MEKSIPSTTTIQDWPSVARQDIQSSTTGTVMYPSTTSNERASPSPPPLSSSSTVPSVPPVTTSNPPLEPTSSTFSLSTISPKPFRDSASIDIPPTCMDRIRTWLVDHSTFFRLHFLYFVILGHIGAILIYCIEDFRYSYIDCLYMTYSAVCMVGLASLDVSLLSIYSQVILMILVLLGGVVLASVVPVLLRRYYFEEKAAKAIQNEEERKNILEELTIEYRALGYIRNIVLIYWIVVQLGLFLILGLCLHYDPAIQELMNKKQVNSWWWALFHIITAFNNAGFGLFSDNLMSVAHNIPILIILSIAILFGNTMYPINMRIIVWFCHHYIWPKDTAFKFLLDRPRKCFTHMFRDDQTKLLCLILITLTFIDFFTFLGLDYSKSFLESFTGPERALIGWFQAISTRTAGFNCIDLSLCAAGMQVMYAWLMYVSAYPTVITIRKSADAEEKAKQEAKLLSDELEERDNDINEILEQQGVSIVDPYGEIEIIDHEIDHDNNTSTVNSSIDSHQPSMQDTTVPVQDSDIHIIVDKISKPNIQNDSTGPLPDERKIPSHIQEKQVQQTIPKLTIIPPVPSTPNNRKHDVSNETSSHAGKLRSSSSRAFFDNTYYQSSRQLQQIRRNSIGGESTLEINVPLPIQYNEQIQNNMIMDTINKYADKEQGVVNQARNLVARDFSMLFLAFVAICITESTKIEQDTTKALNNWSILFELISAFGTVGLTLGYPGVTSSLSTIFSPFSKFIVMGLMIAGRHRGLPSSIDPAVYLPALLNRTKTRKAPPTTNNALDNAAIQDFGGVVERLNNLSLVVRQKFTFSPDNAADVNNKPINTNPITSSRYGTPSKNQYTMPANLTAAYLAAIAKDVARNKYNVPQRGSQSERKLPVSSSIINNSSINDNNNNGAGTGMQDLRRSLVGIFDPPINKSNIPTSRNNLQSSRRIQETIDEVSETPIDAPSTSPKEIELTNVNNSNIKTNNNTNNLSTSDLTN